jgi:hypothetical protein
VQAGLGIEAVEKIPARIRRPVLYRDGLGIANTADRPPASSHPAE